MKVNAAISIPGATLLFSLAYNPMGIKQAFIAVPLFFCISGLQFALMAWIFSVFVEREL